MMSEKIGEINSSQKFVDLPKRRVLREKAEELLSEAGLLALASEGYEEAQRILDYQEKIQFAARVLGTVWLDPEECIDEDDKSAVNQTRQAVEALIRHFNAKASKGKSNIKRRFISTLSQNYSEE